MAGEPSVMSTSSPQLGVLVVVTMVVVTEVVDVVDVDGGVVGAVSKINS